MQVRLSGDRSDIGVLRCRRAEGFSGAGASKGPWRLDSVFVRSAVSLGNGPLWACCEEMRILSTGLSDHDDHVTCWIRPRPAKILWLFADMPAPQV
jgi:hypothetical protein